MQWKCSPRCTSIPTPIPTIFKFEDILWFFIGSKVSTRVHCLKNWFVVISDSALGSDLLCTRMETWAPSPAVQMVPWNPPSMIPGTAWYGPPQNKYKLQTKKEQSNSLILESIRLWWGVFSGLHGPSCLVGLQPWLNTCITGSTLCYNQTPTTVYFILLETTSLTFCRWPSVRFMYMFIELKKIKAN